jgi:aminopeptidase
MNPIEFGAKQAVANCLKVQSNEKVVIITDRETESLADALKTETTKIGAEAQKFVMEDYGDRPTDGVNPIQFPSEIATALASAQVSFYIAAGKAGELQSFRMPMIKVVEENNIRHGHMPGFTEIMMSQGMSADYSEIQKISKQVYDIVTKASEIRVTTKGGTDVTVKIDPKYKWVICDGNIKPGAWSNLPDGEVFTVPTDANGTVVIDGCLGDFFTEKYGDLSNTPVTYTLEGGRALKDSVTCPNNALKDEFMKYTFETDENSNRVGEFAIGTNIGLTKLIGNLLQDEKFPGIHIALGDAYSDKTGAEWTSKAHNDGVMKHPTIIVDGTTIMKDGTFTL